MAIKRWWLALVVLAVLLLQPAGAGAVGGVSTDRAFGLLWGRTDQLVAGGLPRSWYWGPSPFARLNEPFGGGARLVEYYDKGRMEINDPLAARDSPYFVANGRLLMELVSGLVQTGPETYAQRAAAGQAVVGDGVGNPAPSYATLAGVVSVQPGGRGLAANDRRGQLATSTLAANGAVATNAPLAERYAAATRLTAYLPSTQHNIPAAFWAFLNQRGAVLSGPGNRELQSDGLVDWVATMGYPVSEAYWLRATISGVQRDVLVQAFERRMLSYTPSNAPGFQVEMTNVGLHYYGWRYGSAGEGWRLAAPVLPLRVVFPSVQIDAPLKETYVEGGIWQVADFAAGHLYSTSYPGAGGNSVYAGHNNWRGEVFRYLYQAQVGDRFSFLMSDGSERRYVVTETHKVQEAGVSEAVHTSNAQFSAPTVDERVTLITCWPYTTFTHRIIVIGKPLP